MKIFWSWQSDTHQESSRYFIRDVLRELAADLSGLDGTDEAERSEDDGGEGSSVELDHDTQGVAGSPPIAETILRKIREAAVFVADITPVGVSPSGKRLANPNVMIELGYALKALSHERILLIMNLAEGASLRTLPFDLRHWRAPVAYKLSRDIEDEKKEEIRQFLKADLRERLIPCLELAMRIQRDGRRISQPQPEFKLELLSPEKAGISEIISQRVDDLGVDTLEEIKAKTPKLPVPLNDPPKIERRSLHPYDQYIASGPINWTAEETRKYNNAVEYYWSQYEKYLTDLYEFQQLQLRTFKVSLQLSNLGTKPGTNVDAEVDFPPEITLCALDRLPRSPPIPSPPPRVRLRSDIAYGRLDQLDFPPVRHLRKENWTEIDPVRRRVRFHIDRLKHGYNLSSEVFAMGFVTSDVIGMIELQFNISEDETPKSFKGPIQIKFVRVDD